MPVEVQANGVASYDEEEHDLRLIDKGTITLEASVSGQAERYRRGKTSHTIHVWWARRPHGAMRALTFASLMPDNGEEVEHVLRGLAFANSSNAEVIDDAQRLLKSQYVGGPKVLDVFGGGGTIPYEAALLGARVSALDYNPLSVFIQQSNLVFLQDAISELGLAELVRVSRDAGTRVLATVRDRTDDLFPLRRNRGEKGTFAYFWSYRLHCEECGYEFLLMKRPWLSRKAGKFIGLTVTDGSLRQSATIKDFDDGDEAPATTAWQGRNGTACCPRCGRQHRNPSIQKCSDVLVAVGELLKPGKAFKSAPKSVVPSDEYLEGRERQILKTHDLRLPRVGYLGGRES